jgi:isopentenyldiphosphate isomerase
VNASLFYCCIQLPSRPITFPSLLDSTMTSHPVSSIFTKLNADKLKTLSEQLTSKQFYEMMPKVMNQDELDFLQASTLEPLSPRALCFTR